jgi:ketosteroid isomerase-like protein|nr:nuclear transport factor 2 family protein [uncultured Brevundimonas sp.]
MTFRLLSLVAAASLAGAAPVWAQDHSGHVVEGVVAPAAVDAATAVDAFHAALKAGDTAGALALMDPEVVIFEEGYVERSRDEYASHHLASDAAFAAETQSVHTRRSGWALGDAAWIVTEARTTGAFNGRVTDRITTETMVLSRTTDGWRIRHIHWSSRASD